VKRKLIGVLAAGTMLLGVATAAGPSAAADSGATCTLVGAKVVGSSGGRSYKYAVSVRMSNLTGSSSRITTTLSGRAGRTYGISATVAGHATTTRTSTFSAPRGTTFTVVACSRD
jgi:hypothetical protein